MTTYCFVVFGSKNFIMGNRVSRYPVFGPVSYRPKRRVRECPTLVPRSTPMSPWNQEKVRVTNCRFKSRNADTPTPWVKERPTTSPQGESRVLDGCQSSEHQRDVVLLKEGIPVVLLEKEYFWKWGRSQVKEKSLKSTSLVRLGPISEKTTWVSWLIISLVSPLRGSVSLRVGVSPSPLMCSLSLITPGRILRLMTSINIFWNPNLR